MADVPTYKETLDTREARHADALSQHLLHGEHSALLWQAGQMLGAADKSQSARFDWLIRRRHAEAVRVACSASWPP